MSEDQGDGMSDVDSSLEGDAEVTRRYYEDGYDSQEDEEPDSVTHDDDSIGGTKVIDPKTHVELTSVEYKKLVRLLERGLRRSLRERKM